MLDELPDGTSLLLCLFAVLDDSPERSLIDLTHETLADFGDNSSESTVFEEDKVTKCSWCVLVGVKKNVLFADVDVEGVEDGLTTGRSEEEALQCVLFGATDDTTDDCESSSLDNLLVKKTFIESTVLHVRQRANFWLDFQNLGDVFEDIDSLKNFDEALDTLCEETVLLLDEPVLFDNLGLDDAHKLFLGAFLHIAG